MWDRVRPHNTTTASFPNTRVPVVVATTAMLTFISFWRAAAIVFCDLGSSAFYAGGIAEQAIGKAAPNRTYWNQRAKLQERCNKAKAGVAGDRETVTCKAGLDLVPGLCQEKCSK